MIKKLKAGSLQLVTFIVVIIALLLSAFIILIHIHKQYRVKTNHVIEAVSLVDKGIDYTLYNQYQQRDTIALALNVEDYKSVKVHKEFWGIFEKTHSIASIKSNTLKKTALIGSRRDKNSQAALYVKDNNKPLVLVGNTQIKGNAYLPKRGIKSGNISGVSYYGENYIYGKSAVCKSFPQLKQKLLGHIKALKNVAAINFKEPNYIDLKASKQHVNSFENPLQLIYSNSEIKLSNVSVTGHIRIQSQTKITVDASAKLTDVILIAPIIEIQHHVKGTFQAFATEGISVAQHATLDYPSALVLTRDYVKETSNESNMIFIANHSVVKGTILVLGKNLPINYNAQIKIDPNAIIKGAVYCEQNLELRGTVYGTVYTNNFIIKEKGAIYQNHLYNAIISNKELESEFIGLPMESSKKGVAKWLY